MLLDRTFQNIYIKINNKKLLQKQARIFLTPITAPVNIKTSKDHIELLSMIKQESKRMFNAFFFSESERRSAAERISIDSISLSGKPKSTMYLKCVSGWGSKSRF